MQLAIDIGNTRTKIGLFRDRELVEQAIWPGWTLEELMSYANQAGVERVIVSNVAAPDETLFEALSDHFAAVELTHSTPLPFRNRYQTPQTLGRDRLAAVAGAQALHPERHCLVIDCGTCIKYDLLTADGTYHGGNIAPGAAMRLRAMHDYTARLPEAPREMPAHFIGKTTAAALQNGALRGAVLEIEGFAALFGAKASPLRVILTGGDATFFQPHLALGDVVHEPELTLFGLNHILINISHSH